MEFLLNFLQKIDPIWIHLFLIFSTFTENVFPPWPGDTFIVFAGFLMYHKVISPLTTYVSTTLGNFLGAYLMYFMGQKILEFAHFIHKKIKIKFLANLLESMISEEQMEKTQIWFNKWGFLFVVLSRFSAGIRYFVSIVAGITKMNFLLFSFGFLLGILIWNTLLFFGGYLLGENWKIILEWLKMYNILISIFIIMIIFFIIYKKRTHKHSYFL
jgi:membrane protein DedA with SNARE-associated domain